MKFLLRFSSLLVLPVLLCLASPQSFAGHFKTYDQTGYEPSNLNPSWSEEDRTANRTPTGQVIYPHWLLDRPEHYEFLPNVSNWDAQNKHPQAWQGQDWDPSRWNSDRWTPSIAVQKFYEGRIFDRQYIRNGHMPVLMLGPRFYVLSDLDQRRTLKLLTDYTGIFNKKGYTMIELRDWHTKQVVGSYTPQGMYLD
jgi:hypothetical protein